jgi:hypothetical protein
VGSLYRERVPSRPGPRLWTLAVSGLAGKGARLRLLVRFISVWGVAITYVMWWGASLWGAWVGAEDLRSAQPCVRGAE